MKLFGFEISRSSQKTLSAVDGAASRGWWPIIREANSGNWQRNIEEPLEGIMQYAPAFACITSIAGDISKVRLRLVAKDENGIWQETENSSYSPVLRKPNQFQNRIQFIENWLISKLTCGNTYILKGRDNRGVVNSLYILNPNRVRPLVSDDGQVFYSLNQDNLAVQPIPELIVPAREMIHDRFNCLYHPLVGLSPIYASAIAAGQGLRIQRMSSAFFANGARPSGILTAPGEITEPVAERLKRYWEDNYTGDNAARVAVLGDGLSYEAMTMNSTDAQLIEQLKWTAETVCSTFHVPPFIVGVGATPTYNNVEALAQQYYTQCLQAHIEAIELCLDEGLELSKPYGTEFDLTDLLRMDSATQMRTLGEGVKTGIIAPNEARAQIGYAPVTGGDTPYLQQQNYSLEALSKRDAKEDPFGKAIPAPKEGATPALPAPTANDNAAEEAQRALALVEIAKGLTR
jgi:HK97 family phage portal protein